MDYTSPDLAIWLDKDNEIKRLKERLKSDQSKIESLKSEIKKMTDKSNGLEKLISTMKRTQKKLRYRNRKLRKVADTKKVKRSDFARRMIIEGIEPKLVAERCFLSIATVYALKSKLKKEGKLK